MRYVTYGLRTLRDGSWRKLLPSPPPRPCGYFRWQDARLDDSGVDFANWGSRRYEYYWAARAVPIEDRKVIDLGIGLPSQYSWGDYATRVLNPRRFVGIDADPRIRAEERRGTNPEILWMDMTRLEFPDSSFDIAFCISVFEHLTQDAVKVSLEEAHRVLRPGGELVVTLDERWDAQSAEIDWNVLERSAGLGTDQAFGLPDFLEIAAPWFAPVAAPPVRRKNADPRLAHSREWNSCVSYAILRSKL